MNEYLIQKETLVELADVIRGKIGDIPEIEAILNLVANRANFNITELPNLSRIKEGAFQNCSSLTQITIPESVNTIDAYTFTDCTSLKTLVLPDGITLINSYAFDNCISLELDKLPSNLIKLYNCAFNGCSNITISTLPENLELIGWGTFWNCSKISISKIPASMLTIEDHAFRNCVGLKSITFESTPSGNPTQPWIAPMGSNAFYGCANLTTINVPWSEGEVANAPWGATNATINYNYVGGE